MIDFILHFNEHLDEILKDYPVGVYGILALIIFAETGFVVTPFLPGDSLLFAVGTKTAGADAPLEIFVTIFILSLAAIIGNTVNYLVGRRIGPAIFDRESRFIKKAYLIKTQAFYEKHGAMAVILSRFLPIFRTFVPFVAGIGQMDWKKYMLYNVVGGISWVVIGILAGYFFGGLPWVKANFEVVVVGIIVITALPAVVTAAIEYFKKK